MIALLGRGWYNRSIKVKTVTAAARDS
jgi:hypothetical protein